MSSTLSQLSKPAGAVREKVRLGRGPGSGLGKTAGRGQKGQYARVRGFKPHFEGGQTPIQRRLPKRGFINSFGAITAEIQVSDLDGFAAGATVDPEALARRGLTKGRFDRIKVLGDGEVTKALTVSAHAFSRSAAEKITKAGGKVVVLSPGASGARAAATGQK